MLGRSADSFRRVSLTDFPMRRHDTPAGLRDPRRPCSSASSRSSSRSSVSAPCTRCNSRRSGRRTKRHTSATPRRSPRSTSRRSGRSPRCRSRHASGRPSGRWRTTSATARSGWRTTRPCTTWPSPRSSGSADATGALDGGLILMRFANRRLRGGRCGVHVPPGLGDSRVATTAWPCSPQRLRRWFPRAMRCSPRHSTTGLGFAAGTAVVWAGARCLRRIDAPSRRDLVLLAATAAVAFGARAATMLLAVAVVGVVALRRFTRPAPSAKPARRHGAARLVAIGLGPAVAMFGWFYARNIVLYGDIGASQYLLDMFRRQRLGSMLDMIVRWSMWSDVFEGLMSPTTRRRILPPGSVVRSPWSPPSELRSYSSPDGSAVPTPQSSDRASSDDASASTCAGSSHSAWCRSGSSRSRSPNTRAAVGMRMPATRCRRSAQRPCSW